MSEIGKQNIARGQYDEILDYCCVVGSALGATGFDAEAVVVINEVLADPPSGDRGDANRDSARHSSEDEFVEILNTGSEPVAIGGWQLSDQKPGSKGPFTFPSDTVIDPGEYIVLFGGGGTLNECSMSPEFGKVCFDDGTIGGGLKNSGDAVFLINPALHDTIARAEWGKDGGEGSIYSAVSRRDWQVGIAQRFPGQRVVFARQTTVAFRYTPVFSRISGHDRRRIRFTDTRDL